MADTKKKRNVRRRLIEIYGKNCWMGYTLDKKNPFTYHHIHEVRNGGKITLENGALLTYWAHCDLNQMCNQINPLYVNLNDLFRALNDSMCPPTVEYYKEVNRILLLASEEIHLSQYSNLTPDYGELREKLEKLAAGKKRNTKVQTQYIQVKGVFIPATYEVENIDFSSIIVPEEQEQKEILRMPYNEEIEPIEIPYEYEGVVKHKNRNKRRYTYK